MLKVNMRTGETEQCSLLDLMEGGVKELADRDLQRVLENLKDVNTDPKMTPGQMCLDETGNVTPIKARA